MSSLWRRGPTLPGVALLAVILPFYSCSRPPAEAGSQPSVKWTLTPAAPAVGPAMLTVILHDAAGKSIANARVRLEGHMSHAGMTPVFAEGTERTPGVYDLSFAFTMQGDWVLLLAVTLPDDVRIERRIDVANVRPSG